MYHVFANKQEQDWASQENEKELHRYLEQAANSKFKWYNDKEKLRKFKYNIINTVFKGNTHTTERLDEINEVSDVEENPMTPLLVEQGTAVPCRPFPDVLMDENRSGINENDDDVVMMMMMMIMMMMMKNSRKCFSIQIQTVMT